ncbi:MAG: membrane protein insertion efficiency factor YidD [Nannocystaceae bacterium]
MTLLGWPAWLALRALRLYQLLVSPILGPQCRFYPSCSSYAMDCIACFGMVRGALLGAGRLLRCHPWCKGGLDFPPCTGSRPSLRVRDSVETRPGYARQCP